MPEAILQIRDLNVYYGASHALQGVDLTLQTGVLSVVGRNGMGKTTLCKTIMGMVPAASGSVQFNGQSLNGMSPQAIARSGIGYVPQGRRLWRSLSVDEHLKLVAGQSSGAWSVERIYGTFPRLAERKNNGGGQLSGGEQQMLAIARALLMNPSLLVMDEPTEGLAPVIVSQVETMLRQLAEDGDTAVLLIEQNIGVATEVAQDVAIMVNGRINRVMDAASLAADRDLQQRLLGVGRHGHEDAEMPETETSIPANRKHAPSKIWLSNPKPPNRWSNDVPVVRLNAQARTVTELPSQQAQRSMPVDIRPLSASGAAVVLVAGTLDTKGPELRFVRDLLNARGIRTALVDLSTSGRETVADIPARQIGVYHPQGPGVVFSNDRGQSVAGMATAFELWMKQQANVAGIISAGGSGGTAMATPAMRTLPVGTPKIMISTVASGQVERYVGPADIMMMHSVADVQGLNSITRQVLANGAEAMAGMVVARRQQAPLVESKPAVGLTMFGVTTPCVQQITSSLESRFDCLVFHATGVGGRSMEKLVDSQLLQGVIDVTTTEVCDHLMGGVFAASEDRFGAMAREQMPYIGACGALDMVNFGAPDTVPERYRGRLLYEHNPQVTLMRTTADENRQIGVWIGERLNRMEAPVRFFLPEGGVSLLDAPGMAFHDPEADAALFTALEATVRQTSNRQLIRLPHNLNDQAFSDALVENFMALNPGLTKPSRKRG